MSRPKCPGTEGDGPGMWSWDTLRNCWTYTVSDEDMARGKREREQRERKAVTLQLTNKSNLDETKKFICKQIMKADKQQLRKVLHVLRFICHPDLNGSHDEMVELNRLLDSLKD